MILVVLLKKFKKFIYLRLKNGIEQYKPISNGPQIYKEK